MITRTVLFTTLLTAGIALTILPAQSALLSSVYDPAGERKEELPSIFDRMEREQPLPLILQADFSQLIDHRFEDVVLLGTATFPSVQQPQTAVALPVEVSLRGKFRRRICSFPPLRLKFVKEDLQRAGLSPKYQTLKLVTHCVEDESASEQAVLREYLAYQLYGLLTENAYRTQLVRIVYRDVNGRQPDLQRLGFLIEDTDELAHRLQGKECEECLNPPLSDVAPKEATLLSVFQYMIGNSDWNTMALRNLKFVQREAEDRHLLVPYDFDFSGLVHASYAVPNPDYPIRDVRDRVFIGYEVDNRILQWALNYVKFKKTEIVAYINQFDLLSRADRREVLDYLETFFRHVNELDVNRNQRLYQRLTAAPFYYSADVGREGQL